jgi:hypothetical protein
VPADKKNAAPGQFLILKVKFTSAVEVERLL